ncbi:hypothetical protein F5146DRAFT_1218576 [Armillaria mellea]|nr:hypothetical protein F5146DRAFT_1218576 [Armillaria mellea]
MSQFRLIVSPTKSTHQGDGGDGSGGISVTKQMHKILDQRGCLSCEMGGQTLRELYSDRSSSFDPYYDKVVKELESGDAPDLEGTETPYKFGYLTIVVSGAQRLEQPNPQHIKVLKYLISRGAPVDLPDITEYTAPSHGTMNHLAKLGLCRVLLESGSDPNLHNHYGEVPLLDCFQTNGIDGIGAIDLLMEFGADINIADADGYTPRRVQLKGRKINGDQGMRILQEARKRQCPTQAVFKVSDCKVLFDSVTAYVSTSVAYYASLTFQAGSHWPTHKPHCQTFSMWNTVTLISYYSEARNEFVQPLAKISRDFLSIPTPDTPQSHHRFAYTPKNLSADSPKSIVIKFQVPFDALSNRRNIRLGLDLLVHTKKRDLVCTIRRIDGPE